MFHLLPDHNKKILQHSADSSLNRSDTGLLSGYLADRSGQCQVKALGFIKSIPRINQHRTGPAQGHC
jgi:hypothetical protein